MTDVRVVSPDGRRGTVKPEELQDALDQGFRTEESVAAQEQSAKYGDSETRTFLEGTARGASLGLSDYVQAKGANIGTQLGNYFADLTGEGVTQRATGRTVDSPVVDIDREAEAVAAEQAAKADILGRKTANADSALAGELVGGIGLGIATGGLGTAGLAARGTTALGRAAYVAGAGALEGAAFGGAAAANEDFLSDRELTAERILIGAGSGALLGGALGGGASLLGSGLRVGAQKASGLLDAAKSRLGIGSKVDDVARASGVSSATAQADDVLRVRQFVDNDQSITQHIDDSTRLSNSVDGEARVNADLTFEPIYESRGALLSKDLEQPARARAFQLFEGAKAAEGGFRKEQQRAVYEMTDMGNRILEIGDHMDELVMKQAKREDARKLFGTSSGVRTHYLVQGSDGVQSLRSIDKLRASTDDIFDAYKEQLDGLSRYGARLDNGGSGAVKQLRGLLKQARGEFYSRLERGEVGDAVMVVDDLKTSVDKIAANNRNSIVREVLRGDKRNPGANDLLRRHLENEALLGEFARKQRLVNATLTESIRRQSDDMLRGITYEGGESAMDPFRALKKVNSETLGSLLNRLGDAEVAPKEMAIRKWLRAREVDAINRSNAWGDAESVALAGEMKTLREAFEDRMNAVALSRKGAEEWKTLAANTDVPGPVGWVLKGAATITQKIAGVAESATERSVQTGVAQRVSAGSTVDASRSVSVGAGASSATDVARAKAVSGESKIINAASRFVRSVKEQTEKTAQRKPIGAVPIAGVMLIPEKPATITLASQKISALQDPTSQERAETRARFEDLAGEAPELAAAMEARVQTVADFLSTKAPKTTFDLSTPFGKYDAPKYDKREAQSFARYVRAAQDPGAALERLASGEGAREDAETLKALHPKAWNRFVASAMTRLQDAKKKPSYSERLRLSALLGVPMTTFESQEFQQLIAATAGATEAAKAKAMRAPTTTQLARANADTSTRSEGIIARGE